MRTLLRATGITFILIFSTLARGAASAPPLADRVPEDAVIYVGWCGSDALSATPAFAQSHFKTLLDSSNVRELMIESLPRLWEIIAKKSDPEAQQAIKTLQLVAGTMWKYPCAMYFKLDVTGRMPMPRLAIFARAGAASADVQKQIDELITRAGASSQAPPQVMPRSFIVDDIVGLSVGFDDGAASLVGGKSPDTKSLTSSPEFTKALAQLGAVAQSDVPFAIYFNNDALMEIADQLSQQNPQAAALWPRIKEATGFSGFHRAIVACGFDGRDWSDCAFIDAPSPRKGLFAMGEHAPISDESLSMIPVSATSLRVGEMSIAHNFEQLRAMVGEIDANAAGGFNMVMGMAQMYLGIDLEKDLFAALGDDWLMYQDPQIAGNGMLGTVIVNKLADAEKAGRSLDLLAAKLNALFNQATAKDQVEIAFRQLKAGDITVNYLAVPFIAPAWTIHNGYLYIALYPQSALTAARRGKPGKSILGNERFVAMRNRLGVKQATSISFDDLPAAAPDNYQMMMFITRAFTGGMDLVGAKAPELVLPPLPELTAVLAPAASATWQDDAGLHFRSIKPFPGADLISGPNLGAMIAAPAMFAGIGKQVDARRAEQRGRAGAMQGAGRALSEVHLRMIGQAILLYANDNQGRYPSNLGALGTQDITPDAFLFPNSGKPVPPNWNDMTEGQKSEWIEENSDYTYIGAGMSSDIPATMIVAYEHTNPRDPSGINILFGDGHIAFEPMPRAMKLIADQGDKKK